MADLAFHRDFRAAVRPGGAGRAGRAPGDGAECRPAHLHRHQQLHRRLRPRRHHRSGTGRRRPTFGRCWPPRPARRVTPHPRHPRPSRPLPAASPRLAAATGAPSLCGWRQRRPRGEAPPASMPAPTRISCRTRRSRTARTIAGDGWRWRRSPRPATRRDHLAFALAGSDLIFSGDHVMALVDDRGGAAGRVDGRLHGLARPAAGARRGHLPPRPWRAGGERPRLCRAR